jgi:hypothetical protein
MRKLQSDNPVLVSDVKRLQGKLTAQDKTTKDLRQKPK